MRSLNGSFDFSTFRAMARAWPELTPRSVWRRMSPPFDPAKSAIAGETYPEPIRFIVGDKHFPCGWRNADFDNARWTVAQEIPRLQLALGD